MPSPATLTPATIGRAGVDLTATSAASAGGDSWANTGYEYLYVKNGNAGICTVTLVMQQTVDGQAPVNKTVAVPATTGVAIIGPFPPSLYNDAGGLMQVTYSLTATVTVKVVKAQS